jgi:hypothetical protein
MTVGRIVGEAGEDGDGSNASCLSLAQATRRKLQSRDVVIIDCLSLIIDYGK